MNTKPKTTSGHGNVNRRKLTTKQKNTLLKKGKIQVSILGHKKTVRYSSDRDKTNNVKKTATGWYYEWYRRSDNNYEPALRAYHRDEKTFALNRPSKAKRRKFEGDAALRAKKGQRVQRTKRYGR